MVDYAFIIKDQSGNLYEFNNCVNRAWDNYENDVGRCRFFIPHNDVKLTTSSVSDSAFSEIRVYRDGTLVWQGLTSIIQDTIDGTWVYGETFMAALKWYSTRYDQAYAATAIGTIITNEYDNIETRSNNFLTAKITQGTIQSPYQTSTTSNLTLDRTLYHNNFFQFLREMVIVARGEMTSSWSQNSVFNISFHESTPTFTFTRDVGADKSDVIFELDSEILEFNIPRDLRPIENSIKAFAIAEGPTVLTKTSTDSTSQTNFYLREAYPYFDSVSNQTDLDQRTDDLLKELKDPKREMKIKFATGLAPFDGYVMGDNVKLRINRGRVNIDEFRRVIGMEVIIEDSGVEKTTPILQKERS